MTRVHVHQVSQSFQPRFLSGGMAGLALFGITGTINEVALPRRTDKVVVFTGSGSANNVLEILTGVHEKELKSLEEIVCETYAYLMKENKPLGSAYEKALYSNRWNLYVRS